MSLSGERPFRMSGSGRETVPNVPEWSRGPPECLKVVGWPSRMSLSGERPFRMSGSCRETLTDVPEW